VKRLILWSPALLLSLTAVLVTVLIHTETGLHWSFRLAQTQVPGELEAQRLSGRLTGPLEIHGLRYRDDNADLRVDRIALDWRPLSLFVGRVVIRELIVEGSDIEIAGAAQPAIPRTAETRGADFGLTLPFEVSVDRLDIRASTLRLPNLDPIAIDRLLLRANVRGDEIAIDDLHLEAGLFEVDAEGRLPLSAAGPVRVTARFRADVDGQAWDGTTTLAGTPAAIEASLTIDQPIGVLGEARIDALADPPRWQASVGIDPFPLDVLVPDARPVQIQAAEIEADGHGPVFEVSGHLAVRDEEYGRWGAELEGRVDGPRREIRRFLIGALDGDARIEGRALQTAADSPGDDHIELDLRWENLAWPPLGEPLAFGPQGSASLSGILDDYRFTLAGAWLIADLPSLDLILEGNGNMSGLNVQELRGEFLDGQWRGTGLFEWRPVTRWDFALTANGVDPALLHPEVTGRLDAQARVSGSFDESLTLDIDIARLGGTLRDQPLDSHARIAIEDSKIDIRDLFVHAGGVELTGAASLADQWDINWRLAAADLAILHPDLGGTAHSTGTLTGPPDALRLRLALDGAGLFWHDHGIGILELSADLELGDDGQWQAALVADNAQAAGRELGRISIDTEGTAPDHRIMLRIEHQDHRLEQQLAGALHEGRWQTRLRQGRLEETHIGAWSQQADTRLDVTSATIALEDFCWRQDDAVVCVRGEHDAGNLMHAGLDWREIDLSRLDPWLPDGRVAISGMTRGNLEVRQVAGEPGALRLDFRSAPGALHYPLPPLGVSHTLGFESITLMAEAVEPEGLRGELRIVLNEREQISGEIVLPQWRLDEPLPAPEQELHGGLDLTLDDLSVLSLLHPDLQTGPGRITAGISFSGTVGAPRIDGDLHLALDLLSLPRFGVRLDELSLDAEFRHNDWTLAGSASMGQGRLELDGHGTVHNMRDWSGEVALNGENLQTLRMPTAEVITSPAITVRVNPEELVFDGRLVIPRARIEPVAPESIEPVSGDIVIIGEIAPEETPRIFDTHGRIELVLGDQVRLIGMGFEGRLTGRLRILLERDGSVNGFGEIRVVDGRYRAYGQNLAITQGRVLYAGGPIDNPAIDIIASRMRGEIEVGVRVTGTAEQPMVSLFSNPAMDDADILSYLILGRPMDQAGEGDGQLLHQAATSVALVGGEALAERISERFGIAEVTIEAGDDVADAALVLGRALSQRLYVRYIQGLIENTSAFQLRYQLSEKWTIETESGTRSGAGADILYTLER
jgi:translocation and assembly module TamB